jgi:hypothetical protein
MDMTKTTILVTCGLLSTAAMATGTPQPLPTKFSQEQGQVQGQLQGQIQGQEQTQGQSQRAEAIANSWSASDARATSNSGGNTQTTHIVTRESAAALAQGGLFLSNCGFASNAGGSGRGGAGFLGLAFQTRQCNDFTLAGFYFTIGDYSTGCKIIAQTPAGKRQAKRGITLPECQNPVTPEPVAPAPALPSKITVEVKDDAACDEKIKRVTDRCWSK